MERPRSENEAPRQRLEVTESDTVDGTEGYRTEEAIASPMPEETMPSGIPDVAVGGDAKIEKLEEAIALPATNAAQIEPSEVTEAVDRPACPACGRTTKIQSLGRPKRNKDGSSTHRWLCANTDCEKKTFPVKTPPSGNNQ